MYNGLNKRYKYLDNYILVYKVKVAAEWIAIIFLDVWQKVCIFAP